MTVVRDFIVSVRNFILHEQQDESKHLFDSGLAKLAQLWYFCRESDSRKGDWRPLQISSDRQSLW